MTEIADAKELLFSFFARMKQWELECLAADALLRSKKATIDEWNKLKDAQFFSLTDIYADCVSYLPNRDDGMSYGDPTEYDPDTEDVLSTDYIDEHIEIVTRSQSSYRKGEVVRYQLVKCDGQWKLTVKHVRKTDGEWKKASI